MTTGGRVFWRVLAADILLAAVWLILGGSVLEAIIIAVLQAGILMIIDGMAGAVHQPGGGRKGKEDWEMGEKMVALNVYTAWRMEELRALNDNYEKLTKEVHGFEMTHLEGDDALICRALRYAIDELQNNVKVLEREKLERAKLEAAKREATS